MGGFSSITSDETIMNADNASFDGTERGGKMTTNGQLWIGSTASPHVKLGNITSPGGSVTIGYSSPNITLTAGASVPTTFTADTGNAVPVANVINILGGPGVTTSAAGNTVTINSVVFTDTTATTLVRDNGYFATAAGTYNMPATATQGEVIEIICDTAGAVVLDAPANNFIRIGASITSSGGTMTSTSIGDAVKLRYRLATLTWEAIDSVGTWLSA